jgi:glycosyltransferase involved in cell wall biosynthesis
MRVVYCTDTYPPQLNGVSIVTALSVAGLTRLGWQCAVVAPRYPPGSGDAAGSIPADWVDGAELLSVPSIAMPGYPEVRVAVPRRAPVQALVDRFRPDLVHCQTEFCIGRMGQLSAARAGVPMVSSYHTDFSRYTRSYGIGWLGGTVSSYLRRFHRRSRRVYTPSSVSREHLLGLDLPDVEVWGRAVDTELFHPGRRSQAMRAALGIGSRFTFLYVGRLAPEKGVEHVLESFRMASELLPRGVIHLILAGTGPREPALRAAAPPGVTFLGFLERRSRLPDLYANCDAFVFASVTETLGLVVLEAMASGLPVVAVPAGGVRDHLRDGHNGIACSENDIPAMARAMVRLTGDYGLSQRLSRGARRTAEGLDWSHEVERLDQSYREICERPEAAIAAPRSGPGEQLAR